MKDDVVKRVGVVTKIHGAMYTVKDNETGFEVLCTLNGKMKMHSIKLTIGDQVDMEVSTYDLGKGRITYRHR